MNHARKISLPSSLEAPTVMGTQLNPALLNLLQCPLTHSPVSVAEPSVVETINARIKQGGVVSQNGEPVEFPFDAALRNENNTWLIPVRGGIITLVADQLVSTRYLSE
ncbi:MAG: hypothetical protein ACK493_07135 [Planctomycetota bacterium]|jgi:hypothetical protein